VYSLVVVLAVFMAVLMAMLGLMLFLSWCVRPLKPRPRGQATYECGFPAKGDSRAVGFNYLQYASLFLIFDVAAIYLFLFASTPNLPLAVNISFITGILTLGLMILYGSKRRRYYVA
jgi:NADH:ubiquinone oxidoreductase subunit 3 (subunit A)